MSDLDQSDGQDIDWDRCVVSFRAMRLLQVTFSVRVSLHVSVYVCSSMDYFFVF